VSGTDATAEQTIGGEVVIAKCVSKKYFT